MEAIPILSRKRRKMGFIDHILEYCDISTSTHTHKKHKPIQTVEIKVKMDCDGCERKVKNAVSRMRGAKEVEVNRKQSKVTVTGQVEPNKVLNNVKRTGKKAEFWPYIPYNVVYYPYAPQAYDKRAPPGHVKDAAQALPAPNSHEEKYTWIFSDDNPNAACSIM